MSLRLFIDKPLPLKMTFVLSVSDAGQLQEHFILFPFFIDQSPTVTNFWNVLPSCPVKKVYDALLPRT
jgi:hypothetical protein